MKRTLFALALSLFVAAGMLVAQELAGRISGSVVDPTGAVIPGAAVTATHVGTGTVYRATTNAAGRFIIPRVRLGRYDITVETQGFSRAVIAGVQVAVGSTASLKVVLEIGVITEEVVVEGSTSQQIINTVDAELSIVVDERRVLELPLNGRNASHLVLHQAGVYFERTSTGEGTKLIIHGQRHRSINITLDGIDTQDNLNRASSIMLDQPLIALAAENVQEFKIATGNTSSEYSRGGVQISAVTRAGGNDWHGSLFWFNRNTATSANTFFNNSTGVPTPKLLRHQFGGRIGGPIFKDKTFFFFGYEQTREIRGIPVNRTVYTAAARQGIFRYLESIGSLRTTPENVAANPGLVRSVNLLECGPGAVAGTGEECVDDRFDLSSPFVSGGQVTLDPFISTTIFPTIPLPNNFDLGDGLNTGGFRFNSDSETEQHLPAFRLDHIFSQKHAFFGTFNYTDREIRGDFINERETRFPDLEPLCVRITHSRAFGAGLVSSFTPTFTNEFRFGVISGENAFIRNQPYDTPEFTVNLNTITDPYAPGSGNSVRDNETWHVRDSASWVKGRHQIKFGGEWRHRWLHNYSFSEVFSFGELKFDDNDNRPGFSESELRNMTTGGPASDIDSSDTERARDLMNNLVGALGEVEIQYNVTSLNSGYVAGAPKRNLFRVREFDAFINDTWQIRPRLTLNLGLRWEYATVPIETQGLALIPEGGQDAVFGISGPEGFFNPGTFTGPSCAILQTPIAIPTVADVQALAMTCSTPYVPGGANNGIPFWDDDYNNFGPLFSIAWDPSGDGKTSIRAGYRISYLQDHFAIMQSNLDDNEGLSIDQDCVVEDDECMNTPPAPFLLRSLVDASGVIIASGGPTVAPVPSFQLPSRRSAILDSSSQDFRTYAKDLKTPYYQEWNLSLSRELWGNTAFEIRYVGNRGIGLRRMADFNEININAFDPVTGMTFMQSFLVAQNNLACNGGGNFNDDTGLSCITPNPLMTALIAGEPNRLEDDSAMLLALEFNEPGDFIDELVFDTTSDPFLGGSRVRGGSFWGQVLQGRFPANFFQANPFVASARRMVNDGFSSYHAIQLEVRRRLSQGLTLQANYTFNRAIADYDGDSNTLLNDVRPSSVRNNRYQVRDIMPRHLFNANWIYEWPFGPGKLFAPGNRVARKFLEGWQTGGILRWRTGRPISITSGRGTFHRQAVSADNTVNLSQSMTDGELRGLTGTQTLATGPATTGVFWLDPCLSVRTGASCTDPNVIAGLFQLPNPGELGELSHTPIFGPRQFVFDFSLLKRTKVTETVDVEFRWEVFNLSNTTNFNIPNTDIFSTSFGQILSTIETPRVMQFALKINF